MKETLIYKFEKHYIYYLSDNNCSFYILTPYKDYKETNISIRLKSNYSSYDLNKNSIEVVTDELINYYKNLDNYNITLILPVFYDDSLSRIRTVDDLEVYQKVDKMLGYIFNNAYNFLTKNGIKVNSNIYVINNDSFKKFTNFFVARYNNRIEYKTIIELASDNGSFKSCDLIETPNINFVVGKNAEPKLEKTSEIEVETFDSFAKDVINKETPVPRKRQEANSGFVSYVLLGVITFVVSMVLLYVFVK